MKYEICGTVSSTEGRDSYYDVLEDFDAADIMEAIAQFDEVVKGYMKKRSGDEGCYDIVLRLVQRRSQGSDIEVRAVHLQYEAEVIETIVIKRPGRGWVMADDWCGHYPREHSVTCMVDATIKKSKPM